MLWPIRPEIDLPFLQAVDRIRNFSLAVRTASESAGVVSAVRQEVTQFDPLVPVHGFTNAVAIVDASHGPRRLALVLLTLFGALALLLVIVGLYAVVAYNVTQRTREVGLRVAVGATQHDILLMVLAQGARLILFGVLLGAALAGGLNRVM